jgi:TctA family transporter
MDALAAGSAQVFTPGTLGVILLAAVYGIFFGAIPGLTATMAVALVVPLTYWLGPVPALAAVVTLEACAIFAGDIPCALVRIPGTPASAAYADDLYALGKGGQHQRALGRSIVFSVTGGLVGVLALIFLLRPLAAVAGWFTSAEYFWFYVLGLGCAVVVTRGSPIAGGVSLLVGLLLASVGQGAGHATPRFTLGIPDLYHGIDLVPAMIGLFGVSEVFRNLMTAGAPEERIDGKPAGGVFGGAFAELWRRKWGALRSSGIGTVIGMLPGAGADIAAWVSYGVSRRFSKKPEDYGRGSMEGYTDASASNNASLAGAWIPALVFGIPGDSITAIVIGILMMKNLRPGPEILDKQADLVASLYIVFVLANLLLIPIGWLAVRAGGALVRVPRKVLVPVILLFCTLGSYSINGSTFDVGVMLVLGLLGLVLERYGFPLGPVVLGLVLGNPLEEKMIQTLTKSDGSLVAFVDRGPSIVLALLAAALWSWPVVRRLFLKKP